MREMGDLAQQLSERYKATARVTINDGTHLVITFQNAPFEALPDEQRRALARDVARFSRSHYGDATRLDDISVGFARRSRTRPAGETRSTTPYRFTPAELEGTDDSVTVTPAAPPP